MKDLRFKKKYKKLAKTIPSLKMYDSMPRSKRKTFIENQVDCAIDGPDFKSVKTAFGSLLYAIHHTKKMVYDNKEMIRGLFDNVDKMLDCNSMMSESISSMHQNNMELHKRITVLEKALVDAGLLTIDEDSEQGSYKFRLGGTIGKGGDFAEIPTENLIPGHLYSLVSDIEFKGLVGALTKGTNLLYADDCKWYVVGNLKATSSVDTDMPPAGEDFIDDDDDDEDFVDENAPEAEIDENEDAISDPPPAATKDKAEEDEDDDDDWDDDDD